jgi:uncharacterized protein YukE
MVNSSAGKLAVTPDVLRSAGHDLLTTADALHSNIRELAGSQEGVASANHGFATTAAMADCESGWEHALTVFGTKIAVAGDNITLSAVTYSSTEDTNHQSFGPR